MTSSITLVVWYQMGSYFYSSLVLRLFLWGKSLGTRLTWHCSQVWQFALRTGWWGIIAIIYVAGFVPEQTFDLYRCLRNRYFFNKLVVQDASYSIVRVCELSLRSLHSHRGCGSFTSQPLLCTFRTPPGELAVRAADGSGSWTAAVISKRETGEGARLCEGGTGGLSESAGGVPEAARSKGGGAQQDESAQPDTQQEDQGTHLHVIT